MKGSLKKIKIIYLYLYLGTILLYGFNYTFKTNINSIMDTSLCYIEHGNTKLGIIPQLGGTIVYLSWRGSENLLKANKSLWHTQIKVDATTDFLPLQGHTVWVGAQSAWWAQQDEDPKRKKRGDQWPPDPFLTAGAYTIVQQSAHAITLESQKSPIWGIQIKKEIAINPDGSVYIQATIKNCTHRELQWDVWHNTRLDGYAHAYVKSTKKNIRVESVITKFSCEMPYTIHEDFFSFQPVPPSKSQQRSAKAFIYPTTPDIYAFINNYMLHISCEHISAQAIHPEQALVELYSSTTLREEDALLELETHSQTALLQPQEELQAWQVWNVSAYHGENNIDEHISFLHTYTAQ